LKPRLFTRHLQGLQSPPARGAWIETLATCGAFGLEPSPPARGAWIETDQPLLSHRLMSVAPRAGGVD